MCLVDRAVFSERHDTQCLKETRTRILQVRDTTPMLRGASQWLKLQHPAKAGALVLVVAVICLQLCQPNSHSATCGRASSRQTGCTDHGVAKPRLCHIHPTRRIPAVKSLFVRFGLSVLTRTLTSVQPLFSTPNRIGHYWPNSRHNLPRLPILQRLPVVFGVGASRVRYSLLSKRAAMLHVVPSHTLTQIFWFQPREIPKPVTYPTQRIHITD